MKLKLKLRLKLEIEKLADFTERFFSKYAQNWRWKRSSARESEGSKRGQRGRHIMQSLAIKSAAASDSFWLKLSQNQGTQRYLLWVLTVLQRQRQQQSQQSQQSLQAKQQQQVTQKLETRLSTKCCCCCCCCRTGNKFKQKPNVIRLAFQINIFKIMHNT